MSQNQNVFGIYLLNNSQETCLKNAIRLFENPIRTFQTAKGIIAEADTSAARELRTGSALRLLVDNLLLDPKSETFLTDGLAIIETYAPHVLENDVSGPTYAKALKTAASLPSLSSDSEKYVAATASLNQSVDVLTNYARRDVDMFQKQPFDVFYRP